MLGIFNSFDKNILAVPIFVLEKVNEHLLKEK